MVITISILILSQINAANSLHNKKILETITTYTSRLTISHFTFHASDFKVRRDTINLESYIYIYILYLIV